MQNFNFEPKNTTCMLKMKNDNKIRNNGIHIKMNGNPN